MAIAVIGGLITSTILSLVMVPVVYEVIDDIEAWLKPTGPADHPARRAAAVVETCLRRGGVSP